MNALVFAQKTWHFMSTQKPIHGCSYLFTAVLAIIVKSSSNQDSLLFLNRLISFSTFRCWNSIYSHKGKVYHTMKGNGGNLSIYRLEDSNPEKLYALVFLFTMGFIKGEKSRRRTEKWHEQRSEPPVWFSTGSFVLSHTSLKLQMCNTWTKSNLTMNCG